SADREFVSLFPQHVILRRRQELSPNGVAALERFGRDRDLCVFRKQRLPVLAHFVDRSGVFGSCGKGWSRAQQCGERQQKMAALHRCPLAPVPNSFDHPLARWFCVGRLFSRRHTPLPYGFSICAITKPAMPQPTITGITPTLNLNIATAAAIPIKRVGTSMPPSAAPARHPGGHRTCQAKNSARLTITPTTAAVIAVSGAVNRI